MIPLHKVWGVVPKGGVRVCRVLAKVGHDLLERHRNCWEEANYGSMWKKLMKNLNIDETTSIFHHVYLAWTQIIEEYRMMFVQCISVGTTKKCQDEKFSDANRCVVLQHGHAQKNALNNSANYQAKSRVIVFSSKPLLG